MNTRAYDTPPRRDYTEADFARITATEFADYGFHLTRQWAGNKHITHRDYRNAYILWAMKRFGDRDVARRFLAFAMPDEFGEPVCDINGITFRELAMMTPEQMTDRVRTDVRNLAIGAGISVELAWEKLQMLMPDLAQYRPVTPAEKLEWL